MSNQNISEEQEDKPSESLLQQPSGVVSPSISVFDPIRTGHWQRCVLKRLPEGLLKGFQHAPTHILEAEDKCFFLNARNRTKVATKEFLISFDREMIRRDTRGTLCSVTANMLGTEWVVKNSPQCPRFPNKIVGCMLLDNETRVHVTLSVEYPGDESELLFKLLKEGGRQQGCICVHPKATPVLIERPNAVASTKTTQLCWLSPAVGEPVVVFQFVRLDKDSFGVDFSCPFSPVMAFATALTLF